MRHHLLPVAFFFMATTGAALSAEPVASETSALPPRVKNQALEKMIEYGQELYLRQDLDQALAIFKHTLALDPCNTTARKNLATLAKRLPDQKDIDAFMEKQKCIKPPEPRIEKPVPEAAVVETPPLEKSAAKPAPAPAPKKPAAPAKPAVPTDLKPSPAKGARTTPAKTTAPAAAQPAPAKGNSIAPTTPEPARTAPQPAQKKTMTPPPAKPVLIVENADQGLVTPQEQKPRAAQVIPQAAAASAPVKGPTIAPATPAQPAPLQGATLQEKMADLQKRIQNIENTAQAQNARLDELNQGQPVTKN